MKTAAQLFQHLAIPAYLYHMEERMYNVLYISTNLDLQPCQQFLDSIRSILKFFGDIIPQYLETIVSKSKGWLQNLCQIVA